MKYVVWIPVAYFILEYLFFNYSLFLIDFTPDPPLPPQKKKPNPPIKGR